MVPGKRGSGSTSERATTTTLAPSAAKASAMSLPIPREAPATIATFPASFIALSLPLQGVSPEEHGPAPAIITDCGASDRNPHGNDASEAGAIDFLVCLAMMNHLTLWEDRYALADAFVYTTFALGKLLSPMDLCRLQPLR